jgi:cytochrome c-type biogenesis protein CcmI
MIWLIMGLLVLAGLMFVAAPLYTKNQKADSFDIAHQREVTDYKTQIQDIERMLLESDEGNEPLQAEKTKLERQLLRAVDIQTRNRSPLSPLWLASFFVVFGFGALGLYSMLGSPELTQAGVLQKPILSSSPSAGAFPQNQNQQGANDLTLPQLVERLEVRLKDSPDRPDGWMLYARSLMTLKRYDEAIRAYETVLTLTDNRAEVVEEINSAKSFIAKQEAGITALPPSSGQPGPNAEDIKRAEAMSNTERQDMIKGMVGRLAQKLEDNPQDENGWVRLLRARRVLGDSDLAQQDIQRMQQAFADRPDIAKRILADAGWQPTQGQ